MVKDVDIEALVLKARRLEGLNCREIFPGSILGRLSPPAQKEILYHLRGLSTTISNANKVVTDNSIATTTPYIAVDSKVLAKSTVEDIEQQVSGVCNSIESGMILDANTNLEQAAEDDVAIVIGAKEKIHLRRYIEDGRYPLDNSELPRGSVIYDIQQTGKYPPFSYGKYSGKPVIVEHYHYDGMRDVSPEIVTSGPTRQQLSKVVHQLKLAEPASFHVLPCMGYLCEEHRDRISLVYETQSKIVAADPPVPLLRLYRQEKNIPLGKRSTLALTLAKILQNLHLVGWVHKGWNSSNILFFKESTASSPSNQEESSDGSSALVLANPWIFGFEKLRYEGESTSLSPDYSAVTNAYRHPERWGKPDVHFRKAHDVYALVSRSVTIYLEVMLTILRGSSAMKSQFGIRSLPS